MDMARTAIQDYVKAIYKLSTENNKVTPTQVADYLGVSQAAVTKMVHRLKDLNLARYARSDGLSLLASGQKMALEMIRHHRLIELYLTEALGYTWDQVHDEAEKLEHVISEQFEAQIEKALGYPTRDPHGAPIPSRDGQLEIAEATELGELQPGDQGVIDRVNDDDPDMLAFLGSLGMYPGTRIEMVGQDPYGGSFKIKVSGRHHAIGTEIASHVFIATEDSHES
jgi:DtxR family Mn-dependent transcriptional regulator